MNQKLYVGNLPFSTDEQALEELFGQAGPVGSVRVMRDQATGRARGFAFVEMATEDGARAAIEKFHNAELGGRRLTVNEARPQTAEAIRARYEVEVGQGQTLVAFAQAEHAVEGKIPTVVIPRWERKKVQNVTIGTNKAGA